MSDYEPFSAWDHYHKALIRMARSPAGIVERLHDAVLNHLITVVPNWLPPGISERHEQLLQECDTPARPYDPDSMGSVTATLRDMDEATAIRLVNMLCEIEEELWEAADQQDRDDQQASQERKR